MLSEIKKLEFEEFVVLLTRGLRKAGYSTSLSDRVVLATTYRDLEDFLLEYGFRREEVGEFIFSCLVDMR